MHYCSQEQLESLTGSINMSLISSTKLVLSNILMLVMEPQKQYYSLKGRRSCPVYNLAFHCSTDSSHPRF